MTGPEENHLASMEIPTPEMPDIPKPEYGRKEEYEKAELYEKKEDYEKPELPELQPVEEPFERETVRKPIGPTFVSVDEYRNILDNSNRIRAKLSEAEEFMHRLDEVKAEEEKTFDKWRGQLEDVERKLAHIDRLIERAKR